MAIITIIKNNRLYNSFIGRGKGMVPIVMNMGRGDEYKTKYRFASKMQHDNKMSHLFSARHVCAMKIRDQIPVANTKLYSTFRFG